PTAAFTLDDGNGCAPWLVNFSDQSTGTVNFFFWTFEGGIPATSTDPNPQVLYTTPGIFDVQLEISGPSGDDVILMDNLIEIAPKVIASFSYSINDNEVSFTNTSSNATAYQWDFGDGTPISTAENPVHEYAVPGAYEVTFVATSVFCATVISETIFVNFVDVEDIERDYFINIYPNPSHDFLSIETDINTHLQLQVFSINGKEMISLSREFSNRLDIDIRSIPAGVYVLKLGSEGDFRYFKMIKI
ncbi:MAG: PKD repeat protein, partial [Saprospiraceae bacterium]